MVPVHRCAETTGNENAAQGSRKRKCDRRSPVTRFPRTNCPLDTPPSLRLPTTVAVLPSTKKPFGIPTVAVAQRQRPSVAYRAVDNDRSGWIRCDLSYSWFQGSSTDLPGSVDVAPHELLFLPNIDDHRKWSDTC